jgi:hypothetical protein
VSSLVVMSPPRPVIVREGRRSSKRWQIYFTR